MSLEDNTNGSVVGVDCYAIWSARQGVVEQGGRGQGFLAGFEGFVGRRHQRYLGVSAGTVRCD